MNSIPPELERDLTALFPTPRVPESRDRAILATARHHLSSHTAPRMSQSRTSPSRTSPSRTPRSRTLAGWRAVGAAAALLVAIFTIATWPEPTVVVRRGDIDHNGRVDIADAFRIARAVDRGYQPGSSDVNDDGRVDQADIALVLQTAVQLEPEG